METVESDNSTGVTLGPFLVILGLLAIVFSLDFTHMGLGGNSDPGPRAFPNALGFALLLGGFYVWGRWWLSHRSVGGRRQRIEQIVSRPESPAEGVTLDRGWLNLIVLVLALATYIALLPWLGFRPSTLLFAFGMMVQLRTRWLVAAIMSFLMTGLIYSLFQRFFRVPLPEAVLSLKDFVS